MVFEDNLMGVLQKIWGSGGYIIYYSLGNRFRIIMWKLWRDYLNLIYFIVIILQFRDILKWIFD